MILGNEIYVMGEAFNTDLTAEELLLRYNEQKNEDALLWHGMNI